MKPGIRERLLNTLFVSPKPLSSDGYRAAQDMLFPGRERFISFLRAGRAQEQQQLAKEILLSLIHLHRATPPYRLVLNLLDYQLSEEVKRQPDPGSHVARDHFVHLVNVYLLGVYFFAYFPYVHHRCSRQMNQLRRKFEAGQRAASRTVLMPSNQYEVMGKGLALFVLYHDLGYPLQDVRPEDRGRDEVAQFLAPFSELNSDLLADLSLKAMATLTLAHSVAFGRPAHTDAGEMFLSHAAALYVGSGSPGWQEFLEEPPKGEKQLKPAAAKRLQKKWAGAAYLPSIGGHRLRAFLSVFPDDHFCAILERQSTGQPIAMVASKKQDEYNVIYFCKGSERPPGFRGIRADALAASAFVTGSPPRRGYVWHYFARNAETVFGGNINRMLGADSKSLNRIVRHFGGEGSPLAWADGLEASYLILTDFRQHLVPFEGVISDVARDEVAEHYSAVDRSLSSALRRIPLTVGQAFTDLLAEEAKANAERLRSLLISQGVGPALQLLLKSASDRLDVLVEEVGTELSPEIKVEIEYQTALDVMRERVGREIGAMIDGASLVDYIGSPVSENLTSGDLLDAKDPLLRRIEDEVERMGLPPVQELAGSYRPKHGRDPRWINHGFASLAVILAGAEFFRRCQSGLEQYVDEKQGGVQFLRSAFVTDWPQSVFGARFEVDEILAQVGVATAVHDIYPSALEGAQADFRHSIEKNPFVFLCLLADGLQEWDRARQQNLARSNLAPGHYGDRFDIEIRADVLVIRAWGPGVRVGGKNSFRESLGEYLHGLEKLIRISLEEGSGTGW